MAPPNNLPTPLVPLLGVSLIRPLPVLDLLLYILHARLATSAPPYKRPLGQPSFLLTITTCLLLPPPYISPHTPLQPLGAFRWWPYASTPPRSRARLGTPALPSPTPPRALPFPCYKPDLPACYYSSLPSRLPRTPRRSRGRGTPLRSNVHVRLPQLFPPTVPDPTPPDHHPSTAPYHRLQSPGGYLHRTGCPLCEVAA